MNPLDFFRRAFSDDQRRLQDAQAQIDALTAKLEASRAYTETLEAAMPPAVIPCTFVTLTQARVADILNSIPGYLVNPARAPGQSMLLPAYLFDAYHCPPDWLTFITEMRAVFDQIAASTYVTVYNNCVVKSTELRAEALKRGLNSVARVTQWGAESHSFCIVPCADGTAQIIDPTWHSYPSWEAAVRNPLYSMVNGVIEL